MDEQFGLAGVTRRDLGACPYMDEQFGLAGVTRRDLSAVPPSPALV